MQVAVHFEESSTSKQKRPFTNTHWLAWLLPGAGMGTQNETAPVSHSFSHSLSHSFSHSFSYVYVGQERTRLAEVPLSLKAPLPPPPSLSRFKLDPDPSIASIAVSSNGQRIAMALHTGEVAVSALDTDSTLLTQPLPQSLLPPPLSSLSSSLSSPITAADSFSLSDPSQGSPALSSSSATLDFFLTPRKRGLKDEYKPWGAKQLFVSDDGQYIIFVANDSGVWLWEGASESTTPTAGNWYMVPTENKLVDPTSPLPHISFWSACFFSNAVLGKCVHLTLTDHTTRSLVMTDYLIFLQPTKNEGPFSFPFPIKVLSNQYPASTPPVEGEKVLIPKWDSQGSMLAVALNSSIPSDSSLIVYSSLLEKKAVQRLGKPGAVPSNKHNTWISDLSWTCDSLFIVAITNGGNVMLMTRLGVMLSMVVPDRSINDVLLPCFEGAQTEGAVYTINCHPTNHYVLKTVDLTMEAKKENTHVKSGTFALNYSNVVEGLVFGNVWGIPADPVMAWRLAITCPSFDAKISDLLFYIVDHFSTIFLNPQDQAANVLSIYSEMLEWLTWDEAQNYPQQLAVQLTISTLQFLLGGGRTSPTDMVGSLEASQMDQQRYYVAVHVIRLYMKLSPRSGSNKSTMVQQWRQLAEAAVDPTCLYSSTASTALMKAIGKLAAFQCTENVPASVKDSTVTSKGKVPDALKQGHLLLLEGSLEQAIKSYQQAGNAGVLPWMLLLTMHQDFMSAVDLGESQISNVEVELNLLVNFDLIENLWNFQSPIMLPVVSGNKWSLFSIATFLSDFLLQVNGPSSSGSSPNAFVCTFSPIDADILIDLLNTADSYEQVLRSDRIRQVHVPIRSVAANIQGISKNPESELSNSGQLLATSDFEALSLLVLRYFLLIDKPFHAMMFCEALGGWHVALLIAKILYIWRPDKAQAVIDNQFETYFSRRTEPTPQSEPGLNTSEGISKSSEFSLEDLVVVANISGCLHNALTLRVLDHELQKLKSLTGSTPILTATMAEKRNHMKSFFDVAASISLINNFSALSDTMSDGLRQEKIFRSSTFTVIRSLLFVLSPYIDEYIEKLKSDSRRDENQSDSEGDNIFSKFRHTIRLLWYMHVRDKLAYVMVQPDDNSFEVLFEWALHILPFYDIHSVKTVQEAFFKVVNSIQLPVNSDLAQENEDGSLETQNYWQTPNGQRIATLIARYLPSDQICAPLVGQYNQFLEKNPPLATILEDLKQNNTAPCASPLSSSDQVCWLYESENLFHEYLDEQAVPKIKTMRFRSDIQPFTHPSHSWRALVTWVDDSASKITTAFSHIPTKIILESSLHKFVPATALQQITRDQKSGNSSPTPNPAVSEHKIESPPLSQPAAPLASSASLPSTRPTAMPIHETIVSPAANRRPIKSNSVGAIARPTWSNQANKPSSPLLPTRPRDVSLPPYPTGMPPQHPNKLTLVRSASSPKPSRRLRSTSKEKQREQAELELFSPTTEPRYARPPKRNSLIREASIENITPGTTRSPSPVRARSTEPPSPRDDTSDLTSSSPSSHESRKGRTQPPQDRQRRNTDAQYLQKTATSAPQARPLSASAGARLQGSQSEPLKRVPRLNTTPITSDTIPPESRPVPISKSALNSISEITEPKRPAPVPEVAYPYPSSSEPDLSLGTDTESPRVPYLYPSSSEDIINPPPPSLQSTLHYSSSEDNKPAQDQMSDKSSVDSRKPPPSPAHTSRPTTPLMVDKNDLYLIQDDDDAYPFVDDVTSEASSTVSESPRSKVFKKSHRRAYSDNPHGKIEAAIPTQAPPPDKKSKRRSMMGSFLSFLKNDDDSSVKNILKSAKGSPPKEAKKSKRRSIQLPADYDRIVRAAEGYEAATARSVSPGLREPRRVSRPRSSLQTDVHAYQQEQDSAEVASSHARRKLQRHRLSVSEADLFGRSPRTPSSNYPPNPAEYDSASDAPPSNYIPNRDTAYWDARVHQDAGHRDSHRAPHREYHQNPSRDRESYGHQNPNQNPYSAPPHPNPNDYRNHSEPIPSVRLLRPSDIGSSARYSGSNEPGNQHVYNEDLSQNQHRHKHPLSYSRPEQIQQQAPQRQPTPIQQQPTRQSQHSRKLDEKPMLMSTSTTSTPVVDKNIIANNIKMLRSASMPIPQQKNNNPNQGIQLLATSSGAKHPPAEQPKTTTILSPAFLAPPQEYEYKDGVVAKIHKLAATGPPKSPTTQKPSLAHSLPTHTSTSKTSSATSKPVSISKTSNTVPSNNNEQKKSFVQLLKLDQINSNASTTSTKLLSFHKNKDPQDQTALRAQEEEYENMKKLLILKKIQEEITHSDFLQEVSNTKRVPQTTNERQERVKPLYEEQYGYNVATQSSAGLQEEQASRKTQTLRRVRRRTPQTTTAFSDSSSTAPPNEIHNDTLPISTDNTLEIIDDHQDPTESNPSDSAPKVSKVPNNPGDLYGDLPSAPFYDTKRYGAHHMTTKEIDDELRALEIQREESQFKMSDFLAAQLKKYHTATADPVSSHIKPSSSISVPSSHSDVPKSNSKKHPGKDIDKKDHSVNPAPIPEPISSYSHHESDVIMDRIKHSDLDNARNIMSGDVLSDEGLPKYLPVISYSTEANPQSIASHAHRFLDVVDIDKRAFGEGPVKSTPHKFSQAPIVPKETSSRESTSSRVKLSSPFVPSATSAGGGMHARLEALAGQLDELEQSAHALQHDLAFSVKVVNQIQSESPVNSSQQQGEADSSVPVQPTLIIPTQSLDSPHYSPHYSPHFSSQMSSPHSPQQPSRFTQLLTQTHSPKPLINEHTQQRIDQAMDLAGLNKSSTRGTGSGISAGTQRQKEAVIRDKPRHSRGDWSMLGQSSDLSEAQIQMLLSMSATQDRDQDQSVDWDLVEDILNE